MSCLLPPCWHGWNVHASSAAVPLRQPMATTARTAFTYTPRLLPAYPCSQRHIAATWLWGCMASQHYLVDETADVFSTNICMLEVGQQWRFHSRL